MLHSWGAAVAAAVFSLHGWPGYLLISGLGCAEAVVFLGLVRPGETAPFLGGILAAQGSINLILLIVLAIIAAITGDSVGYEVGRVLGPAMRRHRLCRWIGPRRCDRGRTRDEEPASEPSKLSADSVLAHSAGAR